MAARAVLQERRRLNKEAEQKADDMADSTPVVEIDTYKATRKVTTAQVRQTFGASRSRVERKGALDRHKKNQLSVSWET